MEVPKLAELTCGHILVIKVLVNTIHEFMSTFDDQGRSIG